MHVTNTSKYFYLVALDIVFICSSAVLFYLAPFIFAHIDPSQYLSSDAEWHLARILHALDPRIYLSDVMVSNNTFPIPEFMKSLIRLGGFFSLKPEIVLIICSYGALFVFLIGVYFLLRYAFSDRILAFVIAFACIIPIHAFGGTTFGFPPTGLLQREVALAVIPYLSITLLHGYRKKKKRFIYAGFLFTGLLTDIHPLTMIQFAVLLFALDAYIVRSFRSLIILFFFFLLGLSMYIPGILAHIHSASLSLDMDIIRMRHPYLFIQPEFKALFQQFRRIFLYVLLLCMLLPIAIRRSASLEKNKYRLLTAALLFSGIGTTIGIILEQFTPFIPALPSRFSLWFIFFSMVAVFLSIRQLVTSKKIAYVIIACIFAIQSNIPTSIRYAIGVIHTAQSTAIEDAALHSFARHIPIDEQVILSSNEFDDLASHARTVMQRSIFVSYKDGNVSLYDTRLGRVWRERYAKLTNAMRSSNNLLSLMKNESIHFAILSPRDMLSRDTVLAAYTIDTENGYTLIAAFNQSDDVMGDKASVQK